MTATGNVIVFDDGGFPTVYPGHIDKEIGLDPYKRILDLSNRHDLVVPIAVTAGFIDVNNISGLGMAGPKADLLVHFLLDHQDRLPLWNHGLTHSYMGNYTEYDIYDDEKNVPEEVQRSNLQLSQAIFSDHGFERPTVFVPPAHAWEPGVTDRIAKDVGLQVIAIREFEKRTISSWLINPRRPYLREWTDSEHLETIYRAGIGVPFYQTKFRHLHCLKSSQYIRPSNTISRFIVWRRREPPRQLDHFFAHIQNLIDPDSQEWWNNIIMRLKDEFERPAL